MTSMHLLINSNKTQTVNLLTSRTIFGYALDYLGYKINDAHFSNSTEEGTDYSAKDIHGIETDIKEKKIAFFINNIRATSKTVSRLVKLAKRNNVPVLNVTETLPKAKLSHMDDRQYQQLEKIQNQATTSSK